MSTPRLVDDVGPVAWESTPAPPPIRSDNARTVAQWFGVLTGAWKPYRRSRRRKPEPAPLERYTLPNPAPNSITLIRGASGAGKTRLLRDWMTAASTNTSATPGVTVRQLIDLPAVNLPNRPLVDLFDALDLKDALRLLGRVGLGEVWTYLRTPTELSEGQRWRLRLALALHMARPNVDAGDPPVLICDEFAAVLDRVTACVVARGLRRVITAHPTPLSAILVTSHDDLIDALQPDVIVHCDFTRVHVHTRAT